MDIVKMVDELLELEEKLDHFFLTSYERREFQNEVMERIISADRKTEPSEHRDCINCEDASDCAKCRGFEDEPQTDCKGCDRYEDGGELCDMCALEKGKEDAQTERSE